MKTLEEKIGYSFRDRSLLENALTHSSYANEHRAAGVPSNERLEFLGDSILGLVVADHLYRTRPDLPEGDLTRIRAALVCEGSLVQVAQALDLGSYLKLGKGEDHGGGRARPSIQADAVEASTMPSPPSTWTGASARCESSSTVWFWTRSRRRPPPAGTIKPPFRSWSSGRTARCSPIA